LRLAIRIPTAQAAPPTPVGNGTWRRSERWHAVAQIDPASLALRDGAAGAIGYAIPLIAGQLTGHTREGATASAGALIIGYANLGGPYRLQAKTLVACAGCVCAAVILGAVAQPSVIASAVVAAGWAFIAGLSVSQGPRVALVATLATWSLLLAGDLRLHGQSPLFESALIAAGAAIQVAVVLASARLGPLRAEPPVAAGSEAAIQTILRRNSPSPRRAWPHRHGRWVRHPTLTRVDLRSPTVRHAVRLAVALLIAVIAYRTFSLGFGYWVPLTVLFLLKPDYQTTVVRALGRALGTLTGAAVAWLIITAFGGSNASCLALMIALVGVALGLYRANYALSTIALTTVIALVAQVGGGSPVGALIDRTTDVGVGTLIALAVFLIYPTATNPSLTDYTPAGTRGRSTVARRARSTSQATFRLHRVSAPHTRPARARLEHRQPTTTADNPIMRSAQPTNADIQPPIPRHHLPKRTTSSTSVHPTAGRAPGFRFHLDERKATSGSRS
jgi:Fusaric acid resistance protein-like